MSFGLDNDFSDGEYDEDDEFWASRPKQSRKQTKEETIYGVFAGYASDVSNNSDNGDSYKRQKTGGKPAPSFVSAGATQPEAPPSPPPNNTPSPGRSPRSRKSNSSRSSSSSDEDSRYGPGGSVTKPD
eukprot:GHVN01001657.1.p2 GENE.GHVN01001657.1~~GHVN01001657.1.p2  ORF type:complete len:128 (+),score=13.73 GHVN01001657.1:349-732(+)